MGWLIPVITGTYHIQYKAYVRPMQGFKGISLHNIGIYGTVPPFWGSWNSDKLSLETHYSATNHLWFQSILHPFLVKSSHCFCAKIPFTFWSINSWLVVDLPLWKIWVRQLGWWNSQYMESHKIPWFQTTNQFLLANTYPYINVLVKNIYESPSKVHPVIPYKNLRDPWNHDPNMATACTTPTVPAVGRLGKCQKGHPYVLANQLAKMPPVIGLI